LLYSALRKALRRFEIDLDTGNVTSATSNTLTDSTKNWGTDIWKDMYIEITGGTGAGQIRRISGNTSDTITVTENWSETPDETSTYRIFSGIAELTLLGGIKGNTDNLDISLSALRDALKPIRTHPESDLSGETIPAGEVKNIDKSGLNGYSALVVIVKASYDPSATAGVRVRWLYSPDGSNYDSPEDAEDQGRYKDLTFAAGETRQRTLLIPVLADNVRIQIVNLDSSYAVTVDVWSLKLR